MPNTAKIFYCGIFDKNIKKEGIWFNSLPGETMMNDKIFVGSFNNDEFEKGVSVSFDVLTDVSFEGLN